MIFDAGNINWLIVLGIFIAYFFVDALYALYTLEVVGLRPVRSATIGSLMHFLLAFGVLNYVQNVIYLLPLALGSWFGTFCVVHWKKTRPAKSGVLNKLP